MMSAKTSPTVIETANPTMPRLDPKQWLPVLRNYRELRDRQRMQEAQARATASSRKTILGTVLAALGQAKGAVCGNVTIALKPGKSVPGAITLTDGRRVPLGDISCIIVGKERIESNRVATWFGGREGSDDIEIVGE